MFPVDKRINAGKNLENNCSGVIYWVRSKAIYRKSVKLMLAIISVSDTKSLTF